MFQMPRDYIERCYAGWLGKLIGVRYGAPIEGWTYEQIADELGTSKARIASAIYKYRHKDEKK